ncbi:mannose-1-phosphate guanylyltransferase [Pedobacter chinensis]|uniref:mannose-1-phosphate guanylyltransferase n=1 Tax=Pedobacter chinensis TaxID=2282421 RepID=UPI00267B33CF|nr:sugar phosphate nucleotidyltransferase [Pedobacter chinensis]
MQTQDKNTYVLIMAGGVGSRFWPKSRNNFPKQFIDILGSGKSLLQLTYQRFLKICPSENIYILTNEIYTDIIEEQIGIQAIKNIISEPCRRNTAPCITYATFKIEALNPDANIIIAPSDHLILNEEVFISSLEKAVDFATHNDALITLGITPTRPDTGYGYIKFEPGNGDVYKVAEFLEKPALEKATAFVKSGKYVWNAGIFIWNVKINPFSY